MVGHGGSSAGSYLADPTSPIPSHCASIVATSTLRVNKSAFAARVLYPSNVPLLCCADHVVLCAAMAKRLRDTFHTLMRDCDRRQELLQELIATNTQLRQELRAQMELTQSHGQETEDSNKVRMVM